LKILPASLKVLLEKELPSAVLNPKLSSDYDWQLLEQFSSFPQSFLIPAEKVKTRTKSFPYSATYTPKSPS